MKRFFLPNADSSLYQWLGLIGLFLLIFLAAGWWAIQSQTGRGHRVRRKRKKRHHRGVNPTLSQAGGLPPKRDTDQPPHGL
jgi:hypothetical protein